MKLTGQPAQAGRDGIDTHQANDTIRSEPGSSPIHLAWMMGLVLLAAALLLWLQPDSSRDSLPRLPRGDVAIDAAVAQSLSEDKGFWTPWERSSPFRSPTTVESSHELSEGPAPFGYPADQHPPLWPLAGTCFMKNFGLSALAGLEWASFAAHGAVLCFMVFMAFRLGMGRWSFLPALFYALSGVGSAFSFNGSLYTAQACLYLLAAWLMGRRNLNFLAAFFLGILLGTSYLLNYQSLLLLPAFLCVRALCAGREFFRIRHLAACFLVLLTAATVASPWLMRNNDIFGTPFYSVNQFYLLAKAGGAFAHQSVEGALVVESVPLPLFQFIKGMAGCAWLNIPFLLLLVLALFPGCAALLLARGPDLKKRLAKCRSEGLSCALFILLVFHLAACLAWPALKLRYLVPAAPLVLLLAWQAGLARDRGIHKGWLVSLTLLLGAFCGAVWLKGSVNSLALVRTFLLSYLAFSLILYLAHLPRFKAALGRVPVFCLAMLCISAAGTWPGQAYFNLPPLPDFFGEDKEAREAARSRELAQVAELLTTKGYQTVMGDPRLWHLNPAFQVVEPPKRFEGEDYVSLLRQTARAWEIRYAVLDRQACEGLFTDESGIHYVDGENWTLVDLGL